MPDRWDANELKRVMREGMTPATPFLDLAMQIRNAAVLNAPRPDLAMRLDYEEPSRMAKAEIVFSLPDPDDLLSIGETLRDTLVNAMSNNSETMLTSKKQIVDKLEDLRRQEHEFIIKAVPRLHRLIMEAFPKTRGYFKYAIAHNEDDPTKLTLLRGKKVVARNF